MTTFINAALRPDVFKTAIKVALLVGSILALINHGDKLINLTLTKEAFIQIVLTYLVPYCVSTYSSVKIVLNKDLIQ